MLCKNIFVKPLQSWHSLILDMFGYINVYNDTLDNNIQYWFIPWKYTHLNSYEQCVGDLVQYKSTEWSSLMIHFVFALTQPWQYLYLEANTKIKCIYSYVVLQLLKCKEDFWSFVFFICMSINGEKQYLQFNFFSQVGQ